MLLEELKHQIKDRLEAGKGSLEISVSREVDFSTNPPREKKIVWNISLEHKTSIELE